MDEGEWVKTEKGGTLKSLWKLLRTKAVVMLAMIILCEGCSRIVEVAMFFLIKQRRKENGEVIERYEG